MKAFHSHLSRPGQFLSVPHGYPVCDISFTVAVESGVLAALSTFLEDNGTVYRRAR